MDARVAYIAGCITCPFLWVLFGLAIMLHGIKHAIPEPEPTTKE